MKLLSSATLLSLLVGIGLLPHTTLALPTTEDNITTSSAFSKHYAPDHRKALRARRQYPRMHRYSRLLAKLLQTRNKLVPSQKKATAGITPTRAWTSMR